MANQKHSHSIAESVANVAVGFWMAVLIQGFVLQSLNINLPMDVNVTVTTILTVVSVARSYVIRRIFNLFQ